MDLRTEQDVDRLRQAALLLEAEVRRLLDILKIKSDEIDRLRGGGDDLQRTLKLLEELRARAEKQDGGDDTKASNEEDRPTSRPPRPGHGPSPQENLPTVDQFFEHDDADRTCPCCGGRLEPFEGQFETSEMVDVVDVQYRLVKVHRQKYVCDCGGTVETAPGPERAAEGGRYSLAFAAKVASDKYDLHLPLARQARAMRQHGLHIERHVLWDQLAAVVPALRGAHEALRAHILGQGYCGFDQSGWRRLHGRGLEPWQIWCLTAEDAIYYTIRDDKSAATMSDVLDGFRGTAVCDALSSHAAAARGTTDYRLAHCFAHVVRRFKDASADFEQAAVPLALLRRLYDIDAKAENDAHRRELRRTESRAVMDELRTWLMNTPTVKTTSLGQAVRYTLGIWPGLTVFLEDEKVWLDNNATERGLRGPVVGRKNHYGSKSKLGTQVAAIFYSLIETAKVHKVPAQPYLVEAIRAGRRGEILLPWQMAG